MYQTNFGLQHAIQDEWITEEWHGVLAEQAQLLEQILYQVNETVSDIRHSDAPRPEQTANLEFVFEEALRILMTRSQHHACVENKIAKIRESFDSTYPVPIGAEKRLRVMEQVNATLHANLSLARQQVDKLRQA
ncbi:MAG: hypothetical protein O7G88_01805 [bacterium]|nr:hypothetical protein [bacterium]